MTAHLFAPLELGPVTLQNRIVVSPMCQYSAERGVAADWHIMHIGQFAVANPGLIFLEGTAVMPEGRISKGDLSLYTDEQEAGIRRLVQFVAQHSGTKLGIQLFHAGRKGSQRRPWENGVDYGQGDTMSVADGGWRLKAPSALAYSDGYPTPDALTIEELKQIKAAFVASAIRADNAGVDVLELHYAHGYLLHSFLSPVSNTRDDEYGGNPANRMRFPLEVFSSVAEVWPGSKAIGARISGSDFGLAEDAWDIEDAVAFGKELTNAGAQFLDVSGGFLSPEQDFMSAYGPGFQVPLAERVKQEVGLPTLSVGMITRPSQAEDIVANGRADGVAIARGMLLDPRWPWRAALELGAQPAFPPQYERTFSFGYAQMVVGENAAAV